MKLTKMIVEKALPPTDKDQIFYRDEELKGFALRVTKGGMKSFIVETLFGGKVRRMTLGKYGKLTAEQARKSLKPLTILDYQRVLKQVVSDWMDKSLLSITKDMIAKRHHCHGQLLI